MIGIFCSCRLSTDKRVTRSLCHSRACCLTLIYHISVVLSEMIGCVGLQRRRRGRCVNALLLTTSGHQHACMLLRLAPMPSAVLDYCNGIAQPSCFSQPSYIANTISAEHLALFSYAACELS